jgi:hypothetical protein
VTALRAIQIDTAPPAGTTQLLGTDDVLMASHNAGNTTITGNDWGKPEAYLMNDLLCSVKTYATGRPTGQVYSGTTTWGALASQRPTSLGGGCLYQQAHANNAVILAAHGMTKSLLTLSYTAVSDAITQIIVVPHHAATEVAPLPLPLSGYEQYQVPNWDQFDAEPITAETLAFARHLLRIMPISLGPPDVAPAADGSIALEWVPSNTTHKLNKLFLDIGPGTDWRAYWKMRDGKFDRLTGAGFHESTKATLDNLFAKLSG